MKSKLLILIVLTVALTVVMTSCSGIFGTGSSDTQGGTQTDNGGDVSDENKPVDSAKYDRIIYSDSKIFDLLADVRTELVSLYGPIVTVTIDTEAAVAKGEIVFGDTGRAITEKAKAALAAQLSGDLNNDCGYIIYVEGGSVAVYWQIPDMAEIAIAAFIAKCIDDAQLVLTDGIVFCDKYDRRTFEAEKYWLALEMKGATPEELEALRNIYTFYDGTKIAGWMANLYDPEIGGFYYSNSARDTDGYLPDIESTSQLISTAVSIGALGNRNKDLPEEIKAKLVAFAKGLQSSKDGYFYHPQWPQGRENLNTDRYGRDLSWATSLITSFTLDTNGDGVQEKQYPNWCAPNGTKCEIHTGTDQMCSFPVVTSYYSDRISGSVNTTLSSSVSSAVSKLTESTAVATASVSQYPDYTSRAAFSAWLEAYNESIKIDSGKAHNLSAIRAEITQQGYADIVLAHLDRVQAEVYEEQIAAGIEPTGLWQTEVNYRLVWGLLKYAVWYNNGDDGKAIDIKYIPYIIKSCTKVTALPPDLSAGYAMNDLYNQWSSITSLISNIKTYNPDQLDLVYELVRESAPDLINNSLEKIKPFKCDDGSVVYTSRGVSPTMIYGVPISLGVREGDVNAMALCVGMYSAIFTSLGYSDVPLCTSEDKEMFIDTLLTCEPIEKTPASDGTFDFEDGIPSSYVSTSTTEGKIELCEDPEDRTNNVVYLYGASSTVQGDTLKFATAKRGSNCYIFETDIYIDSDTDDGYIFQITMGDKYLIDMNKNGSTITVKDVMGFNQSTGKTTRTTFKCDEWHTIRFEFYVAGDETNELERPMTKIWLEDELVAISETYKDADKGGSTNATYSHVTIYAMKTTEVHAYFDNVFAAIDDKVYDPTSDAVTDYRDR